MARLYDRRLSLITAPSAEPIALSDIKTHLRIDDTANDTKLTNLIPVARRLFEQFTGQVLITQTWELWMDRAPVDSYLELPKPPLASVTSVQYYNTSDVVATLATTNYRVSTVGVYGRIVLTETATWPTSLRNVDGFVVRFVAGYGASWSANAPDTVKDLFKEALLEMVTTLYQNPDTFNEQVFVSGQGLPPFVSQICAPFRIPNFGRIP